jgi:hypothetical protein
MLWVSSCRWPSACSRSGRACTIGLNYIPLLIYAILIARAGTAKKEGGPEIARARQYGTQQIIILVPLLVVIVALLQEISRQKAE